jgi:hypothetical protein
MSIERAKRRLAVAAVLLVCGLAYAPVASADVGETIIQRCVHGQSLSGFSQADYNRALKELGADAEEYTNCGSLISQARSAAAAGRGGALGGGEAAAVAILATPAEQRAIARAAHVGVGPVKVGGQIVHPGVVHASLASALSSLPSPLLATIAFLLACLVVAGGAGARNRFRGHRVD